MKKLILFCLFALSATLGYAQGSVRGKVVDTTTGESMPYVNVAVYDKATQKFIKGAISDEKGLFSISGLAYGRYDVKLSYIGFTTLETGFAVDEQHRHANLKKLHMSEDSQTLQEVTVTAQRPAMRLEVDRKSFDVSQDISNAGQAATDVLAATDEAYALLASAAPTTEALATQAESFAQLLAGLLPQINMPAASADGDEHWYQLYTPKRDNRYLTANGAATALTGETNKGSARSMWKFVERTDGTFDIVCRADGSFLNPTAAFNTALTATATQPSAGWTLSHSNTPGLYIIHAGVVQLNQTQSNMGYKVYNYSSRQDGTDRDDAGCLYAIVPAGTVVEEPSADPILTLRDITLDGTQPYRIDATAAAKVFEHGSGTVAIDFTPEATSAAACALMAASNSGGNDYFSRNAHRWS